MAKVTKDVSSLVFNFPLSLTLYRLKKPTQGAGKSARLKHDLEFLMGA